MFKKLSFSLLSCAVSLASFAVDVPLPKVVLQGVMVSNENWTSLSEAGIYTIDVRPNGAITPIHRSEAMANIVAAISNNGTLYAVEVEQSGIYYRQFSTSNWATKGSREEIDVVNLPSDLTYDAVTGKVYGGFWDEEYAGFSRFATFGLGTAEASDVKGAYRDERDIFTVAAAPDGTVYSLFGSYNYLATISTRDGSLTRIGTTGLEIEANPSDARVNSMCYDSANGRLLAVVYHSVGPRFDKKHFSSLYSIDPHTAKATLIMELPGAACFAGLSILDDKPSETAPAAARNITATGDAIEFDIPTASVGGAPLSGTLIAIVNVNGTEKIAEGLTPGTRASVGGFTFDDGINTVKVTLATATERGETASYEFRNGEDIPSVVTNVTLSIADGTASLAWEAPTTGANNGIINPANLRYRIVRFPDSKVMAEAHTATTFTDNTIDPTWKSVYYTVTAKNAQGESAAVSSNRCPGSGSLSVPFSEGFDSVDDFAAWTVVDLNGSATWKYDASGKRAVYDYPRDDTPGDDWLISPPITFEAGKTYKVAYDYRAFSKSYYESFEVAIIPADLDLDKAEVIASHKSFNHTNYERGEATFQASAAGAFHLAIHATSAPGQWSFYIDNVNIDLIDTRVPAVVTDLTVTAAPQGALKANISFTTPDTDIDNAPLVAISKAEIRRSDLSTPIATIDNPIPGHKVSVDDNNISASGTYSYSVVCYNAAGSSVASQTSAFVGVDAPGAVGNLTIVETGRHPAMTWDAPTAGANGGWFDASAVTYRIVRSDGTVVAEQHEELSFTDMSYTSPANAQDAVWYLVTPYCGTTRGTFAQSDLLLTGSPYPTPAKETFASIDMVYYPWITQSWDFRNQNWTLDAMGSNPKCADFTGDGGLATFHSVGEKEGSTSWYYSPIFDLSGLESPQLSFYMYHSPNIAGDASLEVYISTGGEFESTGAIFRRDAGENDRWERHAINLDKYKNVKRLRIAFKGTADGAADICIDGVELSSSVKDDIRISSVSGATRIGKDCTGIYEVNLVNAGQNDITDASFSISDGEQTLYRNSNVEIPVGGSLSIATEVSFSVTGTHKLHILAQGSVSDSNSNLDEKVIEISVVETIVPKPVNLAVAASSTGAELSWDEPSSAASVCDDFEAYRDYAVSGIGEWSMYDGDNAPTYYINMSSVGEYPNSTTPKAFQLLNCATLGIDIWEQGKTHSGNKLMAAMASIGYVNDDWLISPMLNGGGQWISFWARSFTTDGIAPERMRVLTSTTNTNPASFSAITESYIELGGTWRQYLYWMPEGTRYFAINCVSEDAFAMFVDDVCFNDMTVAAWPVSDYEVLRNGISIATVDSPSYTDPEPLEGATYTVRALYGEHGSSAESEAATYTTSSVAAPSADSREIDAIFTPAGAKISGTPAPGIYIIHYTDGHAEKKSYQ